MQRLLLAGSGCVSVVSDSNLSGIPSCFTFIYKHYCMPSCVESSTLDEGVQWYARSLAVWDIYTQRYHD